MCAKWYTRVCVCVYIYTVYIYIYINTPTVLSLHYNEIVHVWGFVGANRPVRHDPTGQRPRWLPLKEQSEGEHHRRSHSGQGRQHSPKPPGGHGSQHSQRPPVTARRTHPNPRSSRAVVTESSLTLPRVGPQVAWHFCHFTFHISSRDVFLFSTLLLLSFLCILSSLPLSVLFLISLDLSILYFSSFLALASRTPYMCVQFTMALSSPALHSSHLTQGVTGPLWQEAACLDAN